MCAHLAKLKPDFVRHANIAVLLFFPISINNFVSEKDPKLRT